MDASRGLTGRAGWRPAEFAELCGFSRSFLYELPPEQRPHAIKLGVARIITESPTEFLARLAAAQANDKAA